MLQCPFTRVSPGLVMPAAGASQDPLRKKEERYTVFSFCKGVLLVIAALLARLFLW